MGITKFFSDAIGSAISLGLASHDDVLRHATPDVLSKYLPKPLWSKLISACLAAPKTDARLVVETITVPVLCEHVPPTILWTCLDQIGKRALDKAVSSAASAGNSASAATAVVAPTATTNVGPPPPAPASADAAKAAVEAAKPAAADAGARPGAMPVPASLPAPPTSPRTTSQVSTVGPAPSSGVPTPMVGTASQPVAVPRAAMPPSATPPVGTVPTNPNTPPYGTNVTQSRVPTVGAGAATRRATGGPATGRPGGPPSPPPKSARPDTDLPVVDVDDAQVIDFGHAEETFVGRGDDAPKR